MPELPEVEVVVRGLQKKVIGRKILNADVSLPKLIVQGRRDFVRKLKDLQIKQVSRRGKYIIIELSNKAIKNALLFHLKLTGQLLFVKNSAPVEPHTHLILFLTGNKQLRFCDLRQFGRVYLIKLNDLSRLRQLTKLGPEANSVSEEVFLRLIGKKRGRIKSLLLNQEFLAGLGNIYADEVLHQAGLHPLRPADKIPPNKLKSLHQAIQNILAEAIIYGGSTTENYLDSEGNPGRFQQKHRVYRRQGQPCLSCGNSVMRIKIGGRGSHFCPVCQKR